MEGGCATTKCSVVDLGAAVREGIKLVFYRLDQLSTLTLSLGSILLFVLLHFTDDLTFIIYSVLQINGK